MRQATTPWGVGFRTKHCGLQSLSQLLLPTSKRRLLSKIGLKNGQSLWVQNAVSKQKGNDRAKVNVDDKGVILKGTMQSPTSTKESRSKGFPKSRASIRAPYTYLPLQRAKPILTRIRRNLSRSIAASEPTGFLSNYWPTSRIVQKHSLFIMASFTFAGNEAALEKVHG